MLSVINIKETLGALFNKMVPNGEIYGDMDFDLAKDSITICILSKVNFDTSTMFHKVQDLYTLPIKLYCTTEPLHPMLNGKRIIWRKGVWYI